MFILACIALGLCLLMSLQSFAVVPFLIALKRRHRAVDGAKVQPKAAIILTLRGPNPLLGECLKRLLTQQYADFKVVVVVDSRYDPVLRDIRAFASKFKTDKLLVTVMKDRYATASLKCSGMIHGVKCTDKSFEILAFIDDDALPHPTWLAELAEPLADDQVGVSYGYRWFVPGAGGSGSWVRYCWNVGAVIQNWFHGTVWSGSMALRRDKIESSGLLSAWATSLTAESSVRQRMRDHRLKTRFVSSACLPNRKAVTFDEFAKWLERLLVARKNGGQPWRRVLQNACLLTLSQVLALGVLISTLIIHDFQSAALAAIGLGVYWGSSWLAIVFAEIGVRRVVARGGEKIRWGSLAAPIRLLQAILLAQFAYPIVMIGVLLQKKVLWRGIEYLIHGEGRIEMLFYRKYEKQRYDF